jgi:RNA polymerase sigma-70 factor (ECF subfamily)
MTDLRNPDASGIRSIDSAADISRAGVAFRDPRVHWTDEALMAAIAVGDQAAFGVVYDRYADLVYSTANRVLRDPALAEDAAQDVFVRIWLRPETFVPVRGRFLSWLLSVARNRAVDEIRARGRRMRREMPAGASGDDVAAIRDEGSSGIDPMHRAELRERQTAVRLALGDLPPEQRLVLELSYFGGFTQQEIALNLHEPLGTVKTRIRLGMQKLRAALDSER